ncbi:hypothetical protein CCM_01059 [Cordyceps militaris CM01]|uniref:DUF7514 domain-containing protein n=1 Tax=Cordyceps militaris (strain CM01) TaxID=983644 RepID=G3J2R9_CORMM|nr:uncharacterized protein CCM_01059 [Cordyceps militaris CM01]EGX96403.1 hypothetical protein CCM_01059 [Cordyceps militaris CM01]
MAPGLITTLSSEEPQGLLRDVARDERPAASSSTSSSRQASPTFHALQLGGPFMSGALPVPDDQAIKDSVLSISQFKQQVAELQKTQTEQQRQLDEVKDQLQVSASPRLTRAYSEGSLPPPTTASTGRDTPPGRAVPKNDARYQATVEDCTESDGDEDILTPTSAPGSPAAEKDGKPDHDRPGRNHTFAASAPTSPYSNHASTTETASYTTVPKTKEVRFSDRPPVVLQRSASARHLSYPGSTSQHTKSHPTRERALSLQDERWGPLFTPQGKATVGMRNALRGLATHLIEVYKPIYSMVVTPGKLLRFYFDYRLDREAVEFTRIFNLTTPEALKNLEKLYLGLQCDFHLVQGDSPGTRHRPYIPALTPEGFVQWTVMLIRAYPEQEFARLSRVFEEMALEAVPEVPSRACDDQRSRRLPRQISRHLFPAEPNVGELQLTTRAFLEWHRSPDRPALIHSNSRNRQEQHLHSSGRDYETEPTQVVVLPHGRITAEDREGRSSRYSKPHRGDRGESPRRSSKRYDGRRDGKDSDRDRRHGEPKYNARSLDESRHRRRDARGSRA